MSPKGKTWLSQALLVISSSFVTSGGTAAFVNNEDRSAVTDLRERVAVVESRQDSLKDDIREVRDLAHEILRLMLERGK